MSAQVGDFDADSRPHNPVVASRPPYDPAEDRERIRGYIALGMTVLFVIVMLALVLAAIAGWLPDDRLEKLAGLLVAPISGLLGAVVGFYYGEQSHAG